MILRNHSKQVYVRSDTLAINDTAWGFGQAIVMGICWSPHYETYYKPAGACAGNTFDIIRLEELTGGFESLDNAGWKDITDIPRRAIPELSKSF